MTPHRFQPGFLSAADAAALSEMSRALSGQGEIQVRPPLSIVRQGWNRQPLIYLQPAATSSSSSSASSSGASTPGTLFGFDVTDLQCIDGVLWVVKRPAYFDPADGVTYGSAYFSHTAGCCDCPDSSGSGGTSPPPPPPPSGGTGGEASCCGRKLSADLYLTLSGGNGTVTLSWTGTYWQWSGTLPCGNAVIIRYDTGCALTYSEDGGETFNGIPTGTVSCGPPFTHTGLSLGLSAPCGSLTGDLSE